MLNKTEQIEEMAKDFCALNMPCEECHLYKNRCHAKKYATRAYTAGYRKASDVVPRAEYDKLELTLEAERSFKPLAITMAKMDVAREIFEEIGKILYKYDKIAERDKSEYGELIVGDIACAIGELKKKCTEDEDA